MILTQFCIHEIGVINLVRAVVRLSVTPYERYTDAVPRTTTRKNRWRQSIRTYPLRILTRGVAGVGGSFEIKEAT